MCRAVGCLKHVWFPRYCPLIAITHPLVGAFSFSPVDTIILALISMRVAFLRLGARRKRSVFCLQQHFYTRTAINYNRAYIYCRITSVSSHVPGGAWSIFGLAAGNVFLVRRFNRPANFFLTGIPTPWPCWSFCSTTRRSERQVMLEHPILSGALASRCCYGGGIATLL